uniref:BTB domain-containing protein n=1 Tax=Caenorhabditis tropicalis TaxID=1561998 RepID=A0A1I7UKR5_9PELO
MNSIRSLFCCQRKDKREDGYLSYDGVWRFCFYEPLFEGAEEKKQISVACSGHDLYCHKQVGYEMFSMVNHIFQLLAFHSPLFVSGDYIEQPHFSQGEMQYFLQIAHGVRTDRLIYGYISYCCSLAKRYQLPNVTHLLQQLILDDYLMNFKIIIAYKLNHLLAIRLRRLKTSKDLARKLKRRNIQKMSGEAMKQCVKFFFEH